MRWTSLVISMTTFILLCFRDIDGPFLLPPVACLEQKETILDLLKYNLKVMQGAAIFYTAWHNCKHLQRKILQQYKRWNKLSYLNLIHCFVNIFWLWISLCKNDTFGTLKFGPLFDKRVGMWNQIKGNSQARVALSKINDFYSYNPINTAIPPLSSSTVEVVL